MASEAVLHRGERRRRRRRTRWGRALATFLLVIMLFSTGLYFITRYPRDIGRISYPLEYTDLIDQYATQYGLDDAHIAAVIYCESSFRADAVSSVGARGLMQIMPDTGEWIAGKLGEADEYNVDRLFEPELNIRYGCWYLNYLNNRFDSDITKVMAAYHAGGTRVDNWLSDTAYSADGETLDSIPFDSTRRYVTNVKNTYEKYKELYAQ